MTSKSRPYPKWGLGPYPKWGLDPGGMDLTDHHAIRLYSPNINPPQPKPRRKCKCTQKKDRGT